MRRLLLFLTIPLLAATACGASLSPAVEVNSDELSRSDLLETTAAIAEPLGQGTPNTADSALTRDIILVVINGMLLQQAAADLGLEITDDHRAEAAELIEINNSAAFPDSESLAAVVELLGPGAAAQLALADEADPGQILAEGYATSNITVDPRFGTWDPAVGQVLPPPAPLAG